MSKARFVGADPERRCQLCKQHVVIKGGMFLGPLRKFICKACKEKRANVGSVA